MLLRAGANLRIRNADGMTPLECANHFNNAQAIPVYVCMYVCVYVCMYVYVHTHAHVCVCVCVCVYVCVC